MLVAVLSTLLVVQVGPSAGADRSVAVGQGGDRFTPATVEIVAGDTVVWTNHGGYHNVHGDGFSNAVSDAAWTFRHTFTSSGTFGYVCDVHPNMRGTVVVSEAPAPPPAETEPAPPEPTPEPAPEPSSEPTAEEPTTTAPRPEPGATATAEPRPTTGDADATSDPASPRPTAEPTGGTTSGGDAAAAPPSPDTRVSETPRPSATPRIAAPASDAGGGGRGAAVAAAVGAALLLAAAGGVWVARSRRP
ncbi:MAG: hypothetical protein KY461_05480 [Actinobacteria bacterium]|nr:hypothetical protein [Actinomycetota bacterium]